MNRWPSRESIERTAKLARIAHEDWMQDWPIEVADPARLEEFVGLLTANAGDWEIAFWLVDLVLESACWRDDLAQWAERLTDALAAGWLATRSPEVRFAIEYWAGVEGFPEESFLVSPMVREALRRIDASR